MNSLYRATRTASKLNKERASFLISILGRNMKPIGVLEQSKVTYFLPDSICIEDAKQDDSLLRSD